MLHETIIHNITERFKYKILDIEVQEKRLSVFFKRHSHNDKDIQEFANDNNLWYFTLIESSTSVKVVFFNKPF